MPVDAQRLQRYHDQSNRLLDGALTEIRSGRWARSEEMLWGSLTLAVRGVALVRGEVLANDQAVQGYATRLGQEYRDRRIRNAFGQISSFADAVERMRESRLRIDYIFPLMDEVTEAIEKLWQIVTTESEPPARMRRFGSDTSRSTKP